MKDPIHDADCDRPACDDMMGKLQQAADHVSKKNKKKKAVDCPLNSAELGRSSWGLLHSMAAWYPDTPNQEDKQSITNFFSALARFYPCTWCADDFRDNLRKAPVVAESRQELCQWLCRQHNIVNEKLGKPLHPCDMKSLDRRWRKNDDCESSGGH